MQSGVVWDVKEFILKSNRDIFQPANQPTNLSALSEKQEGEGVRGHRGLRLDTR